MKSYVKFFSLLLLVFTLASTAVAQGTAKATKEGWHVYLDKAYKESKKTGKPILANFTGSDWCGWCIRLDKSVFSKPEFKKWAKDNVVLLELDFPRRTKQDSDLRKQNRGLAQAFRVSGYPTVWLFDIDKDDKGEWSISALGKTGYRKSVGEFTGDLQEMMKQR